tara:strand:+ start:741 stop:1475 length:735 start_codon:yes stop_codon:yes gene_type:complete
MTDYNKYNTNIVLEVAMKDPEVPGARHPGYFQAIPSDQLPRNINQEIENANMHNFGIDVENLQKYEDMIFDAGTGGAPMAMGTVAKGGSSLLQRLLAKAKQNRTTQKSITKQKNKPQEDFSNRKASREYDKEQKDAYESYMFGESFNDQMLPRGVHSFKDMKKYEKGAKRYEKNFDQYRKSFEETREKFMEGMHVQGLDEESFMRQLRDFEVVYDPSSPAFDPKALLDLVRNTKTKKVAYNLTN